MARPRSLSVPVLLAALVAACSRGSSDPGLVLLPPGKIENSGLATSSGTLAAVGRHALFLVDEFSQGRTDLNGDGDTFDELLHVLQLDTGEVRNLGISGLSHLLTETFLAVHVNEAQEQRDLDGDGSLGALLLVEDLASGQRSFFDLETTFLVGAPLATDGDWVVVPRFSEPVLAVRPATGERRALGHPIAALSPRASQIDGHRIAWVAAEVQGDLNGDGDALDHVVVIHDLLTHTERVLPYSLVGTEIALAGDTLLLRASESSGTDLNQDGDTADAVALVLDLALEREIVLPGRASNPLLAWFGGNHAAVIVREDERDLNGDGDLGSAGLGDPVLVVVDLATGTVREPEFSVHPEVVMSDTWLVFAVSELEQGGTDLDGDGDAEGYVTHALDPRTGDVVNLGEEINSFCFCALILRGSKLLLLAGLPPEAAPSGDAFLPPSSPALLAFDLDRNVRRDLGFMPRTLISTFTTGGGSRAGFIVETGDGAGLGFRTHVYDFRNGRITDTGLAAFDLRFVDDFLVGAVDELDDEDLNGDGDLLDRVVFSGTF